MKVMPGRLRVRQAVHKCPTDDDRVLDSGYPLVRHSVRLCTPSHITVTKY